MKIAALVLFSVMVIGCTPGKFSGPSQSFFLKGDTTPAAVEFPSNAFLAKICSAYMYSDLDEVAKRVRGGDLGLAVTNERRLRSGTYIFELESAEALRLHLSSYSKGNQKIDAVTLDYVPTEPGQVYPRLVARYGEPRRKGGSHTTYNAYWEMTPNLLLSFREREERLQDSNLKCYQAKR